MAAPASAYRDGKLNMGQPSDPKSHLIAILQTSKAVMLSRFYLDELFPVRLPDGTDGVVGAVIIGGANEEMHNITTRGGGGRIMVSGLPSRLLNDAGLNTKAYSSVPELITDIVGVVQGSSDISSSFYDITFKWGVLSQLNGGSVREIFREEVISSNTTETKDLPFLGYPEIKAGDVIKMWSFAENNEGRYVSNDYLEITVTPLHYSAKYNATYASWANSSSVFVDIYSGTSPLDYYSLVYDNEEMSEYAQEGYYVIDGWWYHVVLDNTPQMKASVVAKGLAQAGSYPPGDPGNPPAEIYIPVSAYFGTTRNQVCLKALDMDPSQLENFYINTGNNRYYVDNVGSAYVQDGFYVFPDYTPSNTRFQMTAGFRSVDGNCI